MKLSFSQLQKKEVINLADGKSYGYITDLELDFPRGVLTGITVQGRKVCKLFKAFNRSSIFIPENQIMKIGGDVILVNVSCGNSCAQNVNLTPPPPKKPNPCPPPKPSPKITELFDDEEDYNKF